MNGVKHIKVYAQIALYEQAQSCNLHIYFYPAELLQINGGKSNEPINHRKIYIKKRKEKNLTQEQLTEKLGGSNVKDFFSGLLLGISIAEMWACPLCYFCDLGG